ncbi:SH3 domain-containing protein [Pseudoxanthomonas sacheonensis]|uniref:C40 family peptidase n=1 Tax=Pseudoxanthomonas sacheonensis TaxID=443615 RepID=UPI0013D7464D|nr:SH3 domain-containing protein [Pseudoxanthomonas sacheonensis]KAF1707779.1 NlpC-P60 family protein [Pseudoxanthomonas sacheonensis]
MRTLPTTLLAALLLCGASQARELPPPAPGTVPPHGVIGVTEAQLSPDFWIGRLKQPDRVIMDAQAIAAQNEKLFRLDASMNDLSALPATRPRQTIVDSINEMSALPDGPLYDVQGNAVSADTLQQLAQSLDLDAVPATVPTQYGLALKRTALRRFPTELRVFSSQGDTDIDRFQESALFPGTPVAIAHRSRDGKWLWVESPNYKAWALAEDIAAGTKAAVFGHLGKAPYRIVAGAKVSTVFTREQPQLSELQLDMGVRVPLAGAASDALINGQHSYTSWVVELPIRDTQGALAFAPALLQKNQDTAAAYLPLTRTNLIRQAFKFLGERYGWGHSYNGRDCSGFVSEVYRSMGVELPRNTSDQSISPALDRTTFGKDDGPGPRRAAVDRLQVGDLIYIPGHVMMMIGRVDGAPYVIHDTNGGSFLDAEGNMRSMHLNAVSVTPLLPLRFNQRTTYVDRITSIVRIRP